jgi:RimJ/RimL family protein N-acetyltransferase
MFARTSRLLLRPGWIEDAPALLHAVGDERIVRNLTTVPWPYELADAEAFVSMDRSPLEPTSLVFLRTQGAPELVGCVSLSIKPRGTAVLGYWVAAPHWGRGIATEAVGAAIEHARSGLRVSKLTASHLCDNPASGRVLQKLGFKPSGRIQTRFSAARRRHVTCIEYDLSFGAEPVQEDAQVEAACEALAA